VKAKEADIKISRKDLSTEILLRAISGTAASLGVEPWLVRAACVQHGIFIPHFWPRPQNRLIDHAQVFSKPEDAAVMVSFQAVRRKEERRRAKEAEWAFQKWEAGAGERQKEAEKIEAAALKRAESYARSLARYEERYSERVALEKTADSERKRLQRERLEAVLNAASCYKTYACAAQSLGISTAYFRQLLFRAFRDFERRHGQEICRWLMWPREKGTQKHGGSQYYSNEAITLERAYSLAVWRDIVNEVVDAMGQAQEPLMEFVEIPTFG